MPTNPALKRLRQEDLEFQASMGYTARVYLRKKKEEIQGTVSSSLAAVLGGLKLYPWHSGGQEVNLMTSICINRIPD